jgi:hypothetical protein
MQRPAITFFLFATIIAPLWAVACDFVLPRQTTASSPHGVQREIAQTNRQGGLPNLGEVTPTLFRDSQPTKERFEQLAKMRIAIVVDLRGESQG